MFIAIRQMQLKDYKMAMISGSKALFKQERRLCQAEKRVATADFCPPGSSLVGHA